jgi:hypothetical protein
MIIKTILGGSNCEEYKEPKVKQETYIITRRYDGKVSEKDLKEMFDWIKKNLYRNNDTQVTIEIIKD